MSKKITSLFVALLLVVGVFGAFTASAATVSELQALIAQLQAQISALSGGAAPAAGATAFTRDLSVGKSGADVTKLQEILNTEVNAALPTTGYFGALTKAAVIKFQTANGLPGTGFVGPMTRNVLNGLVTPTTPSTPDNGTSTPNTPSTTLEGTDGSISDVSKLSQYNDEEIGAGQKDVKVLGFEVEASNDGDVQLKSLKLSFDPAGNGAGDSDRLQDYIESVSVWMGSTKIGSANVDDFTKGTSNIYSKTITLDSGAVVKADKTEKFYVTVDSLGNLDSGDIDSDSWSVDVDNIRFVDGSGVVTTDTSTGDVNNMNVGMDFVSFSDAADTELKISTDSATPKEDVVTIDETNNTDNVILLAGKIKLDGSSDVVIDELPITLTTVGGANVAAVTNSLTLKLGDEEYTETVGITSALTGTVTFDNLDYTLEAGKTVAFTVLADINDIDTGNLDEGDTLTASLTSTNRDYVDAENEEGDQLASNERSGTATGKAQEFRTNGIKLSLVSAPTSVVTGQSANDDVGNFKIRFKVKAIGDTVYMSSLVSSYTYAVDKAGTATTANTITGTITNVTDNDKTSVGNYAVEDGDEETFELSVSVPLGAGGTAGQYRTALTGVKWDTSDDTSPANTYTSNLDSFKTSYISLN